MTQTYNLSLEASAHGLLAAVTSTRRGPTTDHPQGGRQRKRAKHPFLAQVCALGESACSVTHRAGTGVRYEPWSPLRAAADGA